MFKKIAFAAAATVAFAATPAMAAHVVYTDPTADTDGDGTGNIVLSYAGPGAVSSALAFNVTDTGSFTAVFEFMNPFSPASAGGSAVFNFDGDVVVFTGATIDGGGIFVPTFGPSGSSAQIDFAGLAAGARTITFSGTLTPSGNQPNPGNSFASIGGQLTLTGVVPEPATWALFILGFGVIGGALRRRNGAMSVSKAKLNFA